MFSHPYDTISVQTHYFKTEAKKNCNLNIINMSALKNNNNKRMEHEHGLFLLFFNNHSFIFFIKKTEKKTSNKTLRIKKKKNVPIELCHLNANRCC